MDADNPLALEPRYAPRGVTKENFRPLAFQGLWYEIASTDTPFAADCDGATAVYEWNESEQVMYVRNTCLRNGVPVRERRATGRIAGDGPPLRLELEFEQPEVPGGKGDYLILDTDYSQFALVGSRGTAYNTRYEYLWLLARQPRVSEPLAFVWLEKARSAGFYAKVNFRDSRIAKRESSCALL